MNDLKSRIDLSRRALHAHINMLQDEVTGHEAWYDRLENAEELAISDEEKTTQKRLLEVMSDRLEYFKKERVRLQEDLAILEAEGAMALAKPDHSFGSLARILRNWAKEPPKNEIDRAKGLDSLPDLEIPVYVKEQKPRRFLTFDFLKLCISRGAMVLMAYLILSPFLKDNPSTLPGAARSLSIESTAPSGFSATLEGLLEKTTGMPSVSHMAENTFKHLGLFSE